MLRGKILTCTGGLYTVQTDEELIDCYAKGAFRKDGVSPLPGDNVILRRDPVSGDHSISAIEERKNSLLRPPLSNLDRLFIVGSVKDPLFSTLNTDKVCSVAIHNNIEPVIVITKKDLDPGGAESLEKIYLKAGFRAFPVSCGDKDLKEKLIPLMEGVSSAFTGPSGAGKSTLISALFDHLELVTGQISKKIARGKNTTRQSVFYDVSEYIGAGSYIADTPGFSQLDFTKFYFFDRTDLADTFPDFKVAKLYCRYSDCTHLTEEGCGVIEGVSSGRIEKSRHESYVRLWKDITQFERFKK